MPVIPFAVWEPDKAETDSQLSSIAENVFPGANSYKPFPGLAIVNSAHLPTRCLGMAAARGAAGNYVFFFGTSADLYKWGGSSFDTVTRASGGSYNVAADDQWDFEQSGTKVVALQVADDVQVIDVDSGSSFTALAGSPPRATSAKQIGDFLILSGLVSNLRKIQWSAVADITGWTPGTNLSDEQEFPEGGPVVGVDGGEVGLVIQDRSLRTLQFLPGDITTIFSFSRVDYEKGAAAKYGYCYTRGIVFFRGLDGFYAYGNGGLRALGDHRVNTWFKNNSDPGREERTICFAAPDRPIVAWAYYSASNSTNYDRLLVYDMTLDRWAYAVVEAQMWAPLVSRSISLDEDTGDPDDALRDSSAPSLDSYAPGRPIAAAIDGAGRFCFLNGNNLAAIIETAEMHLTPGKRSFVNNVYPVVDAENLTITARTRERLQDQAMYDDPVPLEDTGSASVLSSGRLHRFRVSIPAGESWTDAQGLMVDAQPDGDA